MINGAHKYILSGWYNTASQKWLGVMTVEPNKGSVLLEIKSENDTWDELVDHIKFWHSRPTLLSYMYPNERDAVSGVFNGGTCGINGLRFELRARPDPLTGVFSVYFGACAADSIAPPVMTTYDIRHWMGYSNAGTATADLLDLVTF